MYIPQNKVQLAIQYYQEKLILHLCNHPIIIIIYVLALTLY